MVKTQDPQACIWPRRRPREPLGRGYKHQPRPDTAAFL